MQVKVQIAGRTSKESLQELTSDAGNTYFAESVTSKGKPNRGGVAVPLVDLDEITSENTGLVVDGVFCPLHLTPHLTASDNEARTYNGPVTLPNGEIMQTRVTISRNKTGTQSNLITRLFKHGAGGNGRPVVQNFWA